MFGLRPHLMRRAEPRGDEYDRVHVSIEPTRWTIGGRDVDLFTVTSADTFATSIYLRQDELDRDYVMEVEGSWPTEEWASDNLPPTEEEIRKARHNAKVLGLPDPAIDPALRATVAETAATVADTLRRVEALLGEER